MQYCIINADAHSETCLALLILCRTDMKHRKQNVLKCAMLSENCLLRKTSGQEVFDHPEAA